MQMVLPAADEVTMHPGLMDTLSPANYTYAAFARGLIIDFGFSTLSLACSCMSCFSHQQSAITRPACQAAAESHGD